MQKNQLVEGLIRGCRRDKCPCSCCDNDQVEEWAIEFFAFHDRIKDHLRACGIKVIFKADRISFENCSDKGKCKFLEYSLNKEIDPRPIDCKVFPYVIDWDSIDFDKKILDLYYWDSSCPLVKKNNLPEKFRQEVKKIIKRDFSLLFHGASFKIRFHNKELSLKSKPATIAQ